MNFSDTPIHPTTEWLDKKAQQLRSEVAKQLAGNFHADDTPPLSSHLALYSTILPLPSGRSALRFCDIVTSAVLSEHVLINSDPYVVVFLAAKVIEQTFYIFFDPSCPEQPIKNLSVAKHYGTFFTPPDIARTMASGIVGKGGNSTLLDPAVGSGVLLCAPMLFGESIPYKRLVGIELDPQLAAWCKLVVNRVAELTSFTGKVEIIAGDGLEYLLSMFNSTDKPDVIVNPPYGRLRLTSDRATNAETLFKEGNLYARDTLGAARGEIAEYSTWLRREGSFFAAQRGILEYSRLFFRASAELAKSGSAVAVISPDSWMSGRESAPLRRFLAENRLIEEILLLREDTKKFSTVNQATAIVIMNHFDREKFILSNYSDRAEPAHEIDYAHVCGPQSTDFSIPRISGEELEIFKRISNQPKLVDLHWCLNARGEVDQTAQKDLFVLKTTNVKLIRGEHVNRFAFQHLSTIEKPSYLAAAHFKRFIEAKPKRHHFERPRIVGRQCSYAKQKRRLVFCLVPPRHAVGNSCNYLVVDGDSEAHGEERRYFLLALLNSAVLDWHFRVENSNNHVANYEIDNFPIPADTKWFSLISWLSWKVESLGMQGGGLAAARRYMDLLEGVVGLAYGLDPESELRLILEEIGDCSTNSAVNFAVQLERGARLTPPPNGAPFFNHELPTLSELDRLIISHVPEGGNWQNIPESVPSARIQQIRAMSAERGVVRTTYYGRLRRDQPSYTMNTYFNRPGNGTHIHPVLDRTLTSREAARLQGFPDTYFFTGPGGAVRDQIGNAVPPPLAAAIGSELLKHADSSLCVDIFCGAGGLSTGMEAAGWEVLCAIDNNLDALNTYSFNRPCDFEPEDLRAGYTGIFQRDLHDLQAYQDVCGRIKKALNGRQLGLLAGGPPCQGFSHGGYRFTDDKRNDLASIYLHFAEQLRPQIFLLENVEGLASYKGGQVLRDIIATIASFGYHVSTPVWTLCAEEYGVPQMRRRVFVIATLLDSVKIGPPAPTYARCPGRRKNNNAANQSDTRLPDALTVAHAFSGLSLPDRKIPPDYARWLEFNF